jgi:GntR family transcriptional regulator
MHIHLSPADGVPIYLQIVTQVKYLVAAGRLAPGDDLPPIRALAEQLLVNPNTVARAYRELEAAGVVATNRGGGTRVADPGPAPARRDCVAALTKRIDALIAEARQMNVGTEEVVDLVRRRDRAMRPRAGGE